jgi:autotransporter-associated beta strand protein
VVWADGTTVFDGSILARGGLLGGNGGRVETSGKSNLAVRTGTVDAGASAGGSAGLWLLDNDNITVATAGTALIGDVSTVAAKAGTNQTIAPATLVAANADIVLQAENNILISDAVTLTALNKSFTAQAGRNITVSAAISTNAGAITLSANDPINIAVNTTGRVVLNADLNAGTAAVAITNNTGGTDSHQLGAKITGGSLTLTGNAELTATTTLVLSGNSAMASVLSGAGGLTKSGAGVLTLSGANTYSGKTSILDGTLSVGSLNSVTTPVSGASSGLGKPADVASGTIDLGSTTTAGTLVYTGTGET